MKKQMNSLLFMCCFFILTSCIEVKFKESQPINVDPFLEFPEELSGRFLNQDGDTLVIKGRQFSLVNRKSECSKLNEQESLSKNVLLKKWNHNYFLNINEDSTWTVILIEKQDGGKLAVSLIDAESEDIVNRLSGLIQIDTVYSDDGEIIYYLIQPDQSVLKEIIDNDIFSDQYIFQKITE